MQKKTNNWYKLSEKEDAIYYLVRRVSGFDTPVRGLEDKIVEAKSAKQAKIFFFQRFPWLEQRAADDAQSMGERIEYVAIKDDVATRGKQIEKDKWRKIREQQKQDQEDWIQDDAWWNKY